jgi:hypothetical protein
MSISFADHFKIASEEFERTGAFDPILDVDTRLFIDPALLRGVTVEELTASHDTVVEYFTDVLRVVSNIEREGDVMWRKADRMLTFPEVAGLSIGYASSGTSGSGMGADLRARLLETVRQIVKAGVSDPAIFEIVGIFEEGVGPDRISDMIAKIISCDLIRFTQRVCSVLGIPMGLHRLKHLGLEEDLPTHPRQNTPIILVPQEILRDLPVAEGYADVRWIAEQNESLRDSLNDLIGSAWKESTLSEQKRLLRRKFIEVPDVLREIIRSYQEEDPKRYDFKLDRKGEVIWYRTSKRLPQEVPLELKLSDTPTLDEVYEVVVAICEHFRDLVENKQLARLLHDDRSRPKRESAAQLLFFGLASAYCEANNLDLSPESNAGRGPVDFKMSRGFNGKVLVEVKLTSNSQLAHGFEAQLPIYQRAEGTQKGIYLVIDNGRTSDGRMDSFKELVKRAGAEAPRVLWVDGTIRPSASRADC